MCTVQPVIFTPASSASRTPCAPGNEGSSEGWVFSTRPGHRSMNGLSRIVMNPAIATSSTPSASSDVDHLVGVGEPVEARAERGALDEHRGDARVVEPPRGHDTAGRRSPRRREGRLRGSLSRFVPLPEASTPIRTRSASQATYCREVHQSVTSRAPLGTVLPFGITWEAPAVNKKPTVPDSIMMAGGAVCPAVLVPRVLEVRQLERERVGQRPVPDRDLRRALRRSSVGSVALMKFASAKLPRADPQLHVEADPSRARRSSPGCSCSASSSSTRAASTSASASG